MIRKAIPSDFDAISKYYKEFNVNNVDLFEMGPFTHLMVYEIDNEIAGFINYSIIYDRAEIEYIYVDEKYRKQHIASEFMELIITDAIDSGCTNITLEVAENNTKGIALYEKYGFVKSAVRENYYKDCDGILMIRELMKDE